MLVYSHFSSIPDRALSRLSVVAYLPDRHESINDARGESHSTLEQHPGDPLKLEILQMEQCLREVAIL